MLLIGYCCGVRSERRLCQEVHLNLAYRRFCRLGLSDAVPDHPAFSKNRHGRFRDSNLLRALFEASVRRRMAEGIVAGEGFAVDATLVWADAHRQRGLAPEAELNPQEATRAVAEYLAVLDDAAFGAATEVAPKFVSPVDPAARWTAVAGGPAYSAYCINYLIDLKHAVIVDVEPITAVRQTEVTAAKTMITRAATTFDVAPERLIADTGYGSAEMLGWLVDRRGIEPHIPVFDKYERNDGTFSRADFTYDQDGDTYICPAGKPLRKYQRAFTIPRIGVTKDRTMPYRASKFDCDACALKPRCCPNTPARKVPRSIHEAARDKARAIAKTDAYVVSRRERKKDGMLFAHLKRILGFDRLRLRGPCGARAESACGARRLADALRASGRRTEAEAAFRAQLALAPDNPYARINLAAALGEQDRAAEAAALLPAALEIAPDRVDAHHNFGTALCQLGRLAETVAACHRALTPRPDYPDALGNLGNVLREKGRLEEADPALRRALALRPTDEGAYNSLSIALTDQ
jgi:tetratricopeptide (TPR) repeat protein